MSLDSILHGGLCFFVPSPYAFVAVLLEALLTVVGRFLRGLPHPDPRLILVGSCPPGVGSPVCLCWGLGGMLNHFGFNHRGTTIGRPLGCDACVAKKFGSRTGLRLTREFSWAARRACGAMPVCPGSWGSKSADSVSDEFVPAGSPKHGFRSASDFREDFGRTG